MPPAGSSGTSIEVDQTVNRVASGKTASGQIGLTRTSFAVAEAAHLDGARLSRLVEKLAAFLHLTPHELRQRAEPLSVHSHIAIGTSSNDVRVASCHSKVGASCFWNGDEAPEYVAVAVDDTDYDDEYFGELLLVFELRLSALEGHPPPPQQQLCYVSYLQYASPRGPEPFTAYETADDPSHRGEPWCAVHKLSEVITRVPLMPALTYDPDDYDQGRLYDVTDIHGYEYWDS